MKKIKVRYIGFFPVFIRGQGVIQPGGTFLGVEKDLERKDIIKFEKKKGGEK